MNIYTTIHLIMPPMRAILPIILTLNSLSRINLRLGQVEELVCSRMKYSRLYVILLHLVLSAKSVYNFWHQVWWRLRLMPPPNPFYPPIPPPLVIILVWSLSPTSMTNATSFYILKAKRRQIDGHAPLHTLDSYHVMRNEKDFLMVPWSWGLAWILAHN